MKHTLTIFTLIAITGLTGCSSAPPNRSTDVANSAVNVNAPVNASPVNSAAANRSPSDTLRALNTASKAKDVAAIKSLVSSGTMQLIEKSAQNQNKTVDEILSEEDGAPFKELPEMRNEQISGETATVEIRNVITKEFEKIPCARENGEWKIALDVLVQEYERKATEAMKDLPDKKTNEAASNTDRKSGSK